MTFSKGKEVEVTPDEEGFEGAWYTVTILKLQNQNNNTQGKALVQYKNIFKDKANAIPFTENVPLFHIRPLPPQTENPADGDQCFQVKDAVDAFYLDGWWTGSVSEVLDDPKRYIVSFEDQPEEVEFTSSRLRPHWEWVDGKWVKSSKLQEVLVSSNWQKTVELSSNTTTKYAGPTFQLGSSDALKCSSKNHEPCCVSSRKNETDLSTTSKGPKKIKRVKRSTTEDKMDNIKVDSAIEVSKVQKMKEEAESSVPKEFLTECMSGISGEESCQNIKEEKNLQKEDDVSRYKKEDDAETRINRMEQPNVVLKIEQLELVPRNSQSPSAGKDTHACVLEEVFPEEQTAAEAESSAISGLRQAEGTAVVCATDNQREIIKMAGETQAESSLICYNEIQPGVGKTHSAVIKQSNPGDNEPVEHQDLPFVKSLPMWKEVECMEIFQVMPQNPHFHPLNKLNEILREGLALGHMLNYSSMVQMTSKLTVSDPRNHFTNILYSLPELEVLGFDVKLVRDCISQLLCLKDRHVYLQDHSKELQLMVKLYFDELTKIDEEIAANHEKRGELESAKESKTSQIMLLQATIDVITEGIRSLEHEFESLAGSPW